MRTDSLHCPEHCDGTLEGGIGEVSFFTTGARALFGSNARLSKTESMFADATRTSGPVHGSNQAVDSPTEAKAKRRARRVRMNDLNMLKMCTKDKTSPRNPLRGRQMKGKDKRRE